jgi:hypothetical protein
MVTLFSSIWKAGKTTFLSHLLAATKGGDFCGYSIMPVKTLVVSEEGEEIWIERRDRLGIEANVQVLSRPFWVKPTHQEWKRFIVGLAKLVDSRGYQMVLFDTISSLWPVVNENDASEEQSALMPLHALTNRGVASVLVHQFRKSDGAEATASRGSGALPAFADTIVEFRRYRPQDLKDRRRTLRVHGRMSSTQQAELLVELSEDARTYTSLGERTATDQGAKLAEILAALPQSPPGITVEELLAAGLFRGVECSDRQVKHLMTVGAEAHLWTRTGKGVKGSPYRYYKEA